MTGVLSGIALHLANNGLAPRWARVEIASLDPAVSVIETPVDKRLHADGDEMAMQRRHLDARDRQDATGIDRGQSRNATSVLLLAPV